jgi:hypothetical protein
MVLNVSNYSCIITSNTWNYLRYNILTIGNIELQGNKEAFDRGLAAWSGFDPPICHCRPQIPRLFGPSALHETVGEYLEVRVHSDEIG